MRPRRLDLEALRIVDLRLVLDVVRQSLLVPAMVLLRGLLTSLGGLVLAAVHIRPARSSPGVAACSAGSWLRGSER